MKTEILKTLEYSANIIISPDMDGFVSAQLLNRYNGSKVVGTYDKNILCLADGIDPKNCLFVDCDINNPEYVSVGNHMRLLNDNMSSKSFNPNVHFGITKYSDKFPFATAYLIAFATEIETSATEIIRMAYADSTLRNMESYSDNMRTWSDRMKCPAVNYIIQTTDYAKKVDDELRTVYPNQSFTSKRYGKDRYIQTLNEAFVQEKVSHETLIDGYKYQTDKVGLTTMKKYMADIFSYAEVFGGEYSVTYYDRMEW
jgi:hypothetical protein